MDKKREGWLDAVKTIAIFIVLLNHAGVVLPAINFWGGMFYVPIFFVLAGYTYHTRAERYIAFVARKAKRLLVPYFGANLFFLLFFVLKEAVIDGGLHTVGKSSVLGILYARNQLLNIADQSDLTRNAKQVYFMTLQNAPTWFLPALFLSLILFELLMRLFRQNQQKIGLAIALLFLVEIVYHYMCPYLLPWSIDEMPFFLALLQMGYVVKERRLIEGIKANKKYRMGLGIVSLVFVVTALVNGSVNLSIGKYGHSLVLALYNSIIASFLIMLLCYMLEHGFAKSYLPDWIVAPGRYTMTILCYHLFLFMFLQSAITIGCIMLGMSMNVYVMNGFKLVMIVFTIAFFTRCGRVYRERKGVS
jgi:fucose 4-O-acetylase-like acetyltransferase